MIGNLEGINLLAIADHDPDCFLSSTEIEKRLSGLYDRLKLPYGRIEMQTGIKTRGIFDNKMPSDIAASAASKLFENSDIKSQEIDLLIHASVCRDFLEPSTASVIHHKLGLRADCVSFDLSNACLGVVNAIMVAAQMIKSGNIKKALVVTGENATPLINKTIETLNQDENLTRKTIKKFFANFTIGSSGVAVVIGKDEGLASFTHSHSLSDTSAHNLCVGSGSMEALVMETDSEALLKAGVELARKNWNEFLVATNMKEKDFSHYICHQVGTQHQKYLYENLELGFEKDFATFNEFGNTGSAALPLTLSKAISKNIFKSNENIALLGIGSGLHTLMVGLKWN